MSRDVDRPQVYDGLVDESFIDPKMDPEGSLCAPKQCDVRNRHESEHCCTTYMALLRSANSPGTSEL